MARLLARVPSSLEQTLTDRRRLFGTDHPATLASGNDFADAYRTGGQLDKAIPLYEQILIDCRQALEDEHGLHRHGQGEPAASEASRHPE